MTLDVLLESLAFLPATTSWYLADLGEAKGRQELFTRQSPQRLKVLREHAVIESTVSSNRIEGVTVPQDRIGPVVAGRSRLRDRAEEEVRGYRDALSLIHKKGAGLPVNGETVLLLHSMIRGEIWDAGRYKEKDGDIVETYPDGRRRVRFRTVPASDTPKRMDRLFQTWEEMLRSRSVHPLIGLAAFNLDFLCIHPFRDGNGRVSRLLLLLLCYHLGFEVGRFISIERIIEENKARYYETLEESSRGWHERNNDPWPYVNYVLFILKNAYREFEERAGALSVARGAKTEMIEAMIARRGNEPFRTADLERDCPDVSRELIRVVLKELRESGRIRCTGRGPGAVWKKTGP